MGKIQRARYIEKISSALLMVYRKYEIDSPEMIRAQADVIAAFSTEIMSIGVSRTTLNDYISCGVVKALEQIKKEKGIK